MTEDHLPIHVKVLNRDGPTEDEWRVELADGTHAIANFIAFNYPDGTEPDDGEDVSLSVRAVSSSASSNARLPYCFALR
jgi:hypothetical protein